MKETFEEVKQDWIKILKMESNPKFRLDLLHHCLNPRFNHIFRCVEPEVTTQIADELNYWFLKQACTHICPHWDPTDRNLLYHFTSLISYGGSGITPFSQQGRRSLRGITPGLPFRKRNYIQCYYIDRI